MVPALDIPAYKVVKLVSLWCQLKILGTIKIIDCRSMHDIFYHTKKHLIYAMGLLSSDMSDFLIEA